MNKPIRNVSLAVIVMIVALLANYILVALLIRISNAAREPDPVKKRPTAKPVDALPTQVVKRK